MGNPAGRRVRGDVGDFTQDLIMELSFFFFNHYTYLLFMD